MMHQEYDVLIMTTAKDFLRLKSNYPRLVKNMKGKKIFFVGSEEVGNLVKESNLPKEVGFIDENEILPFQSVYEIMKELLQCEDLPRGVAGWYYQQFLKMQYAVCCEKEYYLVWDGDTIPCKPFTMFQKESEIPYLDVKNEYHEEYFITFETLFPGMHKSIQKSFISEHMLMNCEIMRQLIRDIMNNELLMGDTFYERILRSINKAKLRENSFSEFETYGTYVSFRYVDAYRLRNWHSFRYGGAFFDPEKITDSDYEWLSKDFDAISFEKNQSVREDHKDVFTKKEYQEKLSARKILEIAQETFEEGYMEIWDDEEGVRQSDNEKEYEIYEKLGDCHLEANHNKAFLCYENAEFLCKDETYRQILKEKKETLLLKGKVTVKKTSIVIVSYNSQYLMEKCLESIREHCAKEAYDLVVVDNDSTDGVREWLQKQTDIKWILSDKNLGFPLGCNVGIQYSEPNNDIFLLNNDTRMTHNALFWLRMGLYDDDNVGAVGCVSNYSGDIQQVNVEFALPKDYVEYGAKVNVPCARPLEEQCRLCGFAMLIKREVLSKVGDLDVNLSPGYFDDDDLSIRIREAGYKLFVCHNSFIYHAGSQSFRHRNDLNEIAVHNSYYLLNKWKYDILLHLSSNMEAIKKMEVNPEMQIKVLEIGAGCGGTLSKIKYLYPESEVCGIEKNKLAVYSAIKSVNILLGEWNTMDLPFQEGYFDYIIYTNRGEGVLSEEEIKGHIGKYLKEEGVILI